MDISTRQIETTIIVDIRGEITLYNSPEVRRILLDLLKHQRVPRVLVNMAGVPYVDSAGVASFVEALKASRDAKNGFALYALSQSTREVLLLTRLLNLFEIHDTEEDALRGRNLGSAANT